MGRQREQLSLGKMENLVARIIGVPDLARHVERQLARVGGQRRDRSNREHATPQTVPHPPAEPAVPVLFLHCLAFLFSVVRAGWCWLVLVGAGWCWCPGLPATRPPREPRMRRVRQSTESVNRMHNIASTPKKPSRRRLQLIETIGLMTASERQP
jgi:hypothetical protein